jgi:hypothetical protein
VLENNQLEEKGEEEENIKIELWGCEDRRWNWLKFMSNCKLP